MSGKMYVRAASYDEVADAIADLEAMTVAFRHVGKSRDFDAAVVAKDGSGNVEIVRRFDQRKRDGTGTGVAWGLATGAVAALFPAVGILSALAVGGGAGAAIGAWAGRAAGSMTRDDLRTLGEVLDRGDAGLVVVYGPDMADRVASSITSATSSVHAMSSITSEQLAAELRQAEDAATAH